jgi:DNA-binding transcriptional MerR regulator
VKNGARGQQDMVKHEILIYEHKYKRTLLNIGEISRFVGLHPDMIQRFYLLGLIDPYIKRPKLLFEDSVLSRIGLILRLRNDLGINLSSCGLVIDLLERVSELEKRVHYYETKYDR